MTVLVVTWNYPPRRGGMENLLQNLCAGLRERHRVFVITSFADAACPAEKDTFRAPWDGLIPFAFYALWRGAMILARDPQIRIVFGGSALATPLILILARVFRRRAIVMTHGLDVIYRNFSYQLMCVRGLKLCDRVVANSLYTATLARSKAVAQERIVVIPPGIHAERFGFSTDVTATKGRWNVKDQKVILFVGRLAKRKGVKEFIENSLVEIVQESPEAVFLIAGDNPTESLAHHDNVMGEISETVSRLGLQNHVRCLGALSDEEIINLYHASDVVVLPGREIEGDVEGFGIVALEAGAAGKPVVAMRVGGISDALEAGISAVLVDAQDYKSFSQAVLALLRDSARTRAMGEAGRQRTMNSFAWTQICRRYENLFRSAT